LVSIQDKDNFIFAFDFAVPVCVFA